MSIGVDGERNPQFPKGIKVLQIQNPCKKLLKESAFLFLIFHLEHGQYYLLFCTRYTTRVNKHIIIVKG